MKISHAAVGPARMIRTLGEGDRTGRGTGPSIVCRRQELSGLGRLMTAPLLSCPVVGKSLVTPAGAVILILPGPHPPTPPPASSPAVPPTGDGQDAAPKFVRSATDA